MFIINITHDVITNLNIAPILLIIFRYHTVDYLLKMSHILKIEYDLTLTLTVLPPPPTPGCHQACHHDRPQGCGHAAVLVVGAPAAAAALAPRCMLTAAAVLPAATLPLPYPPRFCRCHRRAVAKLPPPPLLPRLLLRCCAAPAAAAMLPPPSSCRCRASTTANVVLPPSCRRCC
jgi:hypothetical protein